MISFCDKYTHIQLLGLNINFIWYDIRKGTKPTNLHVSVRSYATRSPRLRKQVYGYNLYTNNL